MFGKKAHFTVLDLTIPLDCDQEYCDDGYRENLIDYALDLKLAPGTDPVIMDAWIKKYQQDYKGVTGITQVVEKPWLWLSTKQEVHIAYQRFDNVIVQTFVRAKQETRALDAFDQRKKLEDAIKAEYGFSLYFIESKRLPDIGGIYSLLKNKYTPKEIARGGNWGICESLKDFLSRQERKPIEYQAPQEMRKTGPYRKVF